MIFGFVGLIASGKGEAAKYLAQKYKASTYRFSTILRNLLDQLYLEHSRDNMIKMSEIVRNAFGESILARAIAENADKDKNKIIIVEGIRRLADLESLEKMPNFILVEIFADPQIRFSRLTGRGENPDDATKTFEQFLTDHQRTTELSILDVVRKAEEKINNNGEKKYLQKQLDELIKKYAS